LGLRFDLTLGSGWPFGGPQTLVTEAAGRLRCDRVAIPPGVSSVAVPALERGEQLIAVFVQNDSRFKRVDNPEGLRLEIGPVQQTARTALLFFSSRTGQQVKRPALAAEGFVLDHYDRRAIDHHLGVVGDTLLKACGDHLPYAVFSDSLEVFDSDWTADFLSEFRKRRGYDLTPYLPALVEGVGPETASLRHDWGETLTELAEENYLSPIREWAHAHHTLFRSQTYGEPPVILSSNALVDLPEGEHGPEWRTFSAARWASSASHLYGRRITSAETWTWLHSPAFRATPLDLKAEADRHFLQGINQLVGHGWPYSPAYAGEPGWRFYAAAALNDHNPWFQVMPDIAAYLQRISFLLRVGEPANDVALYLPTNDAWAHFTPGKVSVDEMMDALLGANVIPAILNSGHNFDFIDDRAIDHTGIRYRLLILPGVERMPLSTLKRIQAYIADGGRVIATRRLPSLAPGLLDRKIESKQVEALARELFARNSSAAQFIENEEFSPRELSTIIEPDLAVSAEAAPSIGFTHRKLSGSADIYFVVNTMNRALETDISAPFTGVDVEQWNAFDGTTCSLVAKITPGKRTAVRLRLEPYQSTILVLLRSTHQAISLSPFSDKDTIDLSDDWSVTFPSISLRTTMKHLQSWADRDETRFYSGEAIYDKVVQVEAVFLNSASSVLLNFGTGTPFEQQANAGPGMRALLESPVRESAIVFINGQRAGTVWCPPYEIDVKRFLHAGSNTLQIIVANTAMNEMAGKALPSYRLLDLRYGQRFVAQGMEDVAPLPSGLLGPIHLLSRVRNR